MIKIIILLATLFIVSPSTLSAQDWHTDIEAAKSAATQENKHVMLVFQGSDWCAPCIKLHKEIWDSPEFESYAASDLVLVKVDFPRRKQNALSPEQLAHNESLAESYNPQGVFPFVVILDADGNVLGETGYKKLGPAAYIDHLKTFN